MIYLAASGKIEKPEGAHNSDVPVVHRPNYGASPHEHCSKALLQCQREP
jgi:hypothetical protein